METALRGGVEPPSLGDSDPAPIFPNPLGVGRFLRPHSRLRAFYSKAPLLSGTSLPTSTLSSNESEKLLLCRPAGSFVSVSDRTLLDWEETARMGLEAASLADSFLGGVVSSLQEPSEDPGAGSGWLPGAPGGDDTGMCPSRHAPIQGGAGASGGSLAPLWLGAPRGVPPGAPLQTTMSTQPETVTLTVKAYVVLHNFLRRMADSQYTAAGMVDTERGPNHELLQGDWRQSANAQLPGITTMGQCQEIEGMWNK